MRINQLLNLPKIKIYKSHYRDSKLTLYGLIPLKGARCPHCKVYSKQIHDRYERHLNDLSVLEHPVHLILRTRKFKCKNNGCPRKVFSEQTPEISRYARRTNRLDKIIDTIALETNAHQGKIITKLVSVPLSRSTMLRKAHYSYLPTVYTPRVLGVDDWAFRKGVNYGTVLVDMETSRVIDLLPSREGSQLKKWLAKHPGIEIVTRDRASSYASAVKEIHPEAHQVADRFHLLMNLSDALTLYFKSVSGKIKTILNAHKEKLLDYKRQQTDLPKTQIIVSQNKSLTTDPRQAVFQKVKELQQHKYPARKIARELGISRNTVWTYSKLEHLPPRIHRNATNIDLFTGFIVNELQQKGYLIKEIIQKIKSLGYDGSQTQAYHHINKIKQEKGIKTPDLRAVYNEPLAYIKPISATKMSMLIGEELSQIKDSTQRKCMNILLKESRELLIVSRLVKLFRAMIKNRKGNMKRWIDFVQKSRYKLSGLKSLARGLKNDLAAVTNAIKRSWNNGPVEGHVNRIKNIKRQMYGRASFELLRKKVILSQTG